eukprot:maker-scaffold1058_size66152-snap-gene-0.14 protein:Tk06484 transcript:maker-scaffold1058_size66152-snap-gene-0.14-mRNA-1 annotation:"AGAP004309-PA"
MNLIPIQMVRLGTKGAKAPKIIMPADESVCLADFCDIFRCHGYLPRNFTTQEKDGLDKINSMGDYEAIYPDLKVPKPEVGSTELILGPPETLLKLMKLQEKETRSDIEGDRDYFESLQEFLPYLSKVQTRLRSSLHTAITSDFQGSSSNHEKIRRRDTIPRSSKAKNALDSMFVSHQERSHEGNPAPHPDLMEENEEERILEIWQLPEDPADAYCDEAEMNGLQKKCESLIFQCISPLSLSMDDEKFKAFQDLIGNGSQSYLVHQWITMSAPRLPDGAMDKCHVFDVDYSTWDQQRPNESTRVRKCTHWDHDTSMFQNTITQRWELVCDRKHMSRVVQMVYFAGNFIGVGLSGPLSDIWGRKVGYLLPLTGCIVFGALAPMVPNLSAWMCMRFIVGGCSLGFKNVASVYIVELTKSPRWLLAQGQFDQAKVIMRIACSTNKIPVKASSEFVEAQKLKKDQDPQSDRATILDMFRNPGIRRNSLIFGFCWMSFSMGYFGLFYNTPAFSLNIFLVFVLPALILVPMSFVQIWLENKLGRKVMLTAALILAGCLLLVILALPTGSVAITVCAWIGTMACSFAFGVGYNFTRELFPTVLRTTSLSFCSAMARVGSFASPFIAMLDVLGPKIPLLVDGAVVFVAGICSIWIWPETKTVRLPDSIEE